MIALFLRRFEFGLKVAPMPIEVDYRFPPTIDAARQAQVIAVGQTAGTWNANFAHREAQLKKHLAEVVNLTKDEKGYSIATIRFVKPCQSLT
jgi:2,3-diketo-5-methylthiopentyl-1-phosphate enolase